MACGTAARKRAGQDPYGTDRCLTQSFASWIGGHSAQLLSDAALFGNAQHGDSMIGTSRNRALHSNRQMRARVPRCGDHTFCRVQPCSQIDFPGGFRRNRRGWLQTAAHCDWRLVTRGRDQDYFLSL